MKRIVSFELHEYLNNKNAFDLYKYLKMQQPELILHLPMQYAVWYDNFIHDTQTKDFDFYELPQYTDDSSNAAEIVINRKEYMYTLYENNKNIFIEFGNWLYSKLLRFDMDIDESAYPTWVYLQYDSIVKPNTWLLHFTREAYAQSILKNGFLKGVSDMTILGLTTHLNDKQKDTAGYNFAYTVDDAKEFNSLVNNYGDGRNVIMFRASGIRAYHKGDTEYQTMFNGTSAKDIIWLNKNMKNKWQIESMPNIQKADLYDLVDWIELHYYQYRKRL